MASHVRLVALPTVTDILGLPNMVMGAGAPVWLEILNNYGEVKTTWCHILCPSLSHVIAAEGFAPVASHVRLVALPMVTDILGLPKYFGLYKYCKWG